MMDTWAVVVGAAIGASTGPLTTWLASHLAAKQAKESMRRDACYLAAKVVVILEEFALKCAEKSSAQTLYVDTSGAIGDSDISLPELSPFPNEANWKTLEPHLLVRALSLPNELCLSKQAVTSVIDLSDGDDIDDIRIKCAQQSGKCGYIAEGLSR